ncbi:hypothetical protein F2P81_023084 [Scophthalmus maximus]|uniref:Uncharacterized protein n=1 Tax=Scophthalmus maximus TaxID=52904 RepID=A0A6A4RYN5_SCOMX|nr:hypothetical protein F2P81_023084 [Scophthalmus maximus]
MCEIGRARLIRKNIDRTNEYSGSMDASRCIKSSCLVFVCATRKVVRVSVNEGSGEDDLQSEADLWFSPGHSWIVLSVTLHFTVPCVFLLNKQTVENVDVNPIPKQVIVQIIILTLLLLTFSHSLLPVKGKNQCTSRIPCEF